MSLLVSGDSLEGMGLRKCRRFKMGTDALTHWRQFGRNGSQKTQEINAGDSRWDPKTVWLACQVI
jgi:hypothetical protein